MTKLDLMDTTKDVAWKMSGGNPGALRVVMELMTEEADIDPDSALGALGSILSLDQMGIYGSEIWMLYKDVCGCDITKTIAVLRAHQLGFVSEGDIKHGINNWGEGLDVDDLLEQVKERLPDFGGE